MAKVKFCKQKFLSTLKKKANIDQIRVTKEKCTESLLPPHAVCCLWSPPPLPELVMAPLTVCSCVSCQCVVLPSAVASLSFQSLVQLQLCIRDVPRNSSSPPRLLRDELCYIPIYMMGLNLLVRGVY